MARRVEPTVKQPPKKPRKPYEKPRLEVYGDLADIAKATSKGTKLDGGTHQNKHFTR
jgi:hypothetical protein